MPPSTVIRVVVTLTLTASTALPSLAAEATASTADEEEDLAKKLQNPVAALISAPLQNNFEFGGGPKDDGFRYQLNVQPVVPFTLSDDWNVISRTILPIIYQDKMIGRGSQSGLGDIVQSLFLSPRAPGPGGIIWGAGPVFLIPSATDDLLGGEKFGLGPTAVVLKQSGGWTYGALGNHIWSVAGEGGRADISATFLQPFVSYTTHRKTSFSLNSESSYDWENSQWLVPINVSVSQLVKLGKLPVQFGLGGKYFAEGPSGAPEWGLRLSVTFLFPK